MTNTALRNYHRKIENLIENHNINEALSHCINIIQEYPKEIETYRKLGKIFLELPDMQIAERIFKILLAVYPDDFVANIGLSFLSEQAKNWDDAIRYMECAFEIQPANESLQDELKRLYNQRDGIEPAKIRLTRGALIKMYAHSKLYEQAIAEIKLGIYEKPGRIDFKLTLADMLWQSGKHIDAIQTCVEVISQLPYCWTANEILYKAFLNLDKDPKENYYRDRLIELNPYYEFMLPTTESVNDVPDIAIQINDDISSLDAPDQFDWEDFLEKTWTIPAGSENNSPAQNGLDWDSILGEVIEENNYAAISQETTKETKDEITAETSVEKSQATVVEDESTEKDRLNRRDAFIDRLQKRASMRDKVEADQPEVATATQEESNAVPEAVAAGSMEEKPLEAAIVEAAADTESAIAEPPDFPEINDESGLADLDAPVMEAIEENKEPIASAWVAVEEVNSNSEVPMKSSLVDTQQIKVSIETPEEIMLNASKAIEGGNFQYAIKSLLKLAEDDEYLEEIKNILEEACESHSQVSDFWLTLGNIYQRLDLKEKALEVFIRAQKQISL